MPYKNNAESAQLIRDVVVGEADWDDLECFDYFNEDLSIALQLIFFVWSKYENDSGGYKNKAIEVFLHIANMLEHNTFSNLPNKQKKRILERKISHSDESQFSL